MPSFSITPARITEPAVGASVWASGSQVCSGNSGTFTANAMAKAEEDPAHRRPVERVGAGGVVGEVSRLGDLDQVEGERRVAQVVDAACCSGAGRVDRRATGLVASATAARWPPPRLVVLGHAVAVQERQATMPTSMSAEPSIVNRKNFIAA